MPAGDSFPNPGYSPGIRPINSMTLREYYAGLAMAALIGAPNITYNGKAKDITNRDIANCAVGLADSLIAELSKK